MPLSPRLPDLAALDLLLSVAELGSLGRAATAHGISQPSASARIKHLEQLVGLPVLNRSARGSTLTPTGALVADWARNLVEAAGQLDAGITALREQRDSHLRVAASMTVAEYLLPGWLAALRSRAPTTAVSLHADNSHEVAAEVIASRADLGFVEGPAIPSGLATHPVANDRLTLVVSPDHPWARRSGISLQQLAATPLISRERGSGTRSALEHAVREHVPDGLAAPLLELSSTTAIKSAVAAGIGPAVLSSLAVGPELAAGTLVAPPLREFSLDRTLHAIWPTGQRLTGPARDLYAIATRPAPRQHPTGRAAPH